MAETSEIGFGLYWERRGLEDNSTRPKLRYTGLDFGLQNIGHDLSESFGLNTHVTVNI